MRFKSKISPVHYVIIGVFFLCASYMIYEFFLSQFLSSLLMGILILGLILFGYIPYLRKTYYELLDSAIFIKNWILHNNSIKYEVITYAKPIKTNAPAPALCSERIEIRYRTGNNISYTYISPENRDEFLKLLIPRCPRILEEQAERKARGLE